MKLIYKDGSELKCNVVSIKGLMIFCDGYYVADIDMIDRIEK